MSKKLLKLDDIWSSKEADVRKIKDDVQALNDDELRREFQECFQSSPTPPIVKSTRSFVMKKIVFYRILDCKMDID